MPHPSRNKNACIVAAGVWGGSRCLLKSRDRNYTPTLKVYHEVRDGVEVLYVRDEMTDWLEGLNEYGIGLANAALMVAHDEAEKKIVKTVGKKSKDGERILKVLEQRTLDEAIETACTFKGGIKGHTFVSDSKKTVAIEQTSKHDCLVKTVASGKIHVRTNHGIQHPDAGYTEDTEDYVSSVYRRDRAKKVLRSVDRPEGLAPALYRKQKGEGESNSMVRKTDNMRTSSQLVLDLTKKVVRLYILPGESEFGGVQVDLPKGYEPKIKLKVYEYEDTDVYGDAEAHSVKVAAKLLPVMDPQFNLREISKQLILLEDHLFHPRKRCLDCIRKHTLTAEALAEEAVTLDVDRKYRKVTDGLADRIRIIWTLLQNVGKPGAPDYPAIAQAIRKIRKSLVNQSYTLRVASCINEDDTPSAARVAAMKMKGSAFQAPPALLKAFLDWALPLYADNVLFHAQEKLKGLQTQGGPFKDALAELDHLEKTWKQQVEQSAPWPGDKKVFAVPWPNPDGTMGTYAVGFLAQYAQKGGVGPNVVVYKFDHSPKRVTFRKRRSPRPLEDHERSMASVFRQARDHIQRHMAKELVRGLSEDGDATLVEAALLVREAKKLATRPKAYATTKSTRFPINADSLRGWRYRKRFPSDSEVDTLLVANNLNMIKVKLVFRPHASRGGVWKVNDRELEVDVKVFPGGLTIPQTVQQFHDGLDRIRGTARHEMQHVGQTIFGILDDAAKERGLPSQSLRDPERDPYGYHKKYRNSPKSPHALQDVEFYTDLQDEIDEFISISSKIPLDRRRQALSIWTGQKELYGRGRASEFGVDIETREFFRWLLRLSKPKWKKAVGEFVKAVNQRVRVPSAARVAGRIIEFPSPAQTVRPKHVETVAGKKYALSDDSGMGMSWFVPEDEEECPSGIDAADETCQMGAKVIQGPAHSRPFRFLWAYDTERGTLGMWRVTDGNEKAYGSADSFRAKLVALDRKGELNRVTTSEMRAIEREMRKREDAHMRDLEHWVDALKTDYQRTVDEVAQEVFDRDFAPELERRLKEVDRGVVPFAFKVNERLLEHEPKESQLRAHIITEVTSDYTVGVVEDELRRRGIDPDAPDHDIQAAHWAVEDIRTDAWRRYKRAHQ